MTIRTDRIVIDTNVWIFGLRQTPEYLSCARLLDRGDAVVAAHLEHLAVPVLVSENRDFLGGVAGLPFRRVTAAEALSELDQVTAP